MSRTLPPLTNACIFHICNKSIAGYEIFAEEQYTNYFLAAVDYYRTFQKIQLARAARNNTYSPTHLLQQDTNHLVNVLAYCLMPTHYHVLIKADSHDLIVRFISIIENSYSRYFNLNNGRKGPLWQSRFRRVSITSNEQLLHVSRYIHNNPVKAKLVQNPEDWTFSSYKDYVCDERWLQQLKEISIQWCASYKHFVMRKYDGKRIKNLLQETIDIEKN